MNYTGIDILPPLDLGPTSINTKAGRLNFKRYRRSSLLSSLLRFSRVAQFCLVGIILLPSYYLHNQLVVVRVIGLGIVVAILSGVIDRLWRPSSDKLLINSTAFRRALQASFSVALAFAIIATCRALMTGDTTFKRH